MGIFLWCYLVKHKDNFILLYFIHSKQKSVCP